LRPQHRTLQSISCESAAAPGAEAAGELQAAAARGPCLRAGAHDRDQALPKFRVDSRRREIAQQSRCVFNLKEISNMTVVVPNTEKSGALALQAQITTVSARTDSQSQQLTNQLQQSLVNTLIAQGKLSAAAILSTVAFRGTLPVLAQITAAQADVTAWTTANVNQQLATTTTNTTIPALQAQAVIELMASGQMSAATVLSTMTYSGGATQ
jgi:hypothetical protein